MMINMMVVVECALDRLCRREVVPRADRWQVVAPNTCKEETVLCWCAWYVYCVWYA